MLLWEAPCSSYYFSLQAWKTRLRSTVDLIGIFIQKLPSTGACLHIFIYLCVISLLTMTKMMRRGKLHLWDQVIFWWVSVGTQWGLSQFIWCHFNAQQPSQVESFRGSKNYQSTARWHFEIITVTILLICPTLQPPLTVFAHIVVACIVF